MARSENVKNLHDTEEAEDLDLEEGADESEERGPAFVDTPKFRKTVRDRLNDVRNLQLQRASLNDSIAAELSKLQQMGIPRQAAKEAIKRWNLTEEQRDARDDAYALCLKALDIGFQPGLFDEETGT